MELANKVAIVTGAGRGIGSCIALACCQQGAKVVLVSRTRKELESVARLFKTDSFLIIEADVSREKDVERIIAETLNTFGSFDILVNNAGIQGPIGLVHENSVQEWQNTIEVNLIGTFLCTKAALPYMLQRQQGKIINLSGGGATSARPSFSAYAASKAAVVRFTETVAEEVKASNIQVNVISPGPVITRMWDKMLDSLDKMIPTEAKAVENQMNAGGVSSKRVVDLAVFLASNTSNHLTGKLLSAMHDDWRQMGELHPDTYVLRRVDPYTLQKIDPNWSID